MQPQIDDRTKRKRQVSDRRTRANRQNASKSTGPKTSVGKSHSRGNALKHGLFARDLFVDFTVRTENPQEFAELESKAREELQPVGRLEELEVGFIAVCWWKRVRAWRYENAHLRESLLGVASRGLQISPLRASPEYAVLLPLLNRAETQIETSGEVSQDLRESMFASSPWFGEIWPGLEALVSVMVEEKEECQGAVEALTQKLGMEFAAGQEFMRRFPEDGSVSPRYVLLLLVKFVIAYIERFCEQQHQWVQTVKYEEQAIPKNNALDKILRYSAMIDRDLNRAYDRLERLQRRRKGEFVPPSLNLNVNA